MRQFVTTLNILMLSIIFIFIVVPQVGASSIRDDQYEILDSQEITTFSDCLYNEQVKLVKNQPLTTCLYESGSKTVGIYNDRGYGRVGVNFLSGLELYPVKIHGNYFDCLYATCIYLSDSDTLLNMERVTTGNYYSPVLYKNFTKNLSMRNEFGEKYFDYINPEREVMMTQKGGSPFGLRGKPYSVSANGKWLVIYLMNVGIVRYDLKEGTHLRVYPDVLEPRGYPMATSELAIDNSGKNIVHVGTNAGVGRYFVSEGCGDYKLDNSQMDNLCPRIEINPVKLIWSFHYATKPIIYENGTIGFIVISTDNYLKYKKVIIGPAGSSVSLLDLLALGDSFSSGEGETDDKYYLPGTNTEKEKCHVSLRSYPYLVANLRNHPNSRVRSVACSGAITEDITGHAGYLGQRGRLKDLISPAIYVNTLQEQAQRDYLPGRIEQQYFVGSSKANVVTVGIGGNDSGLMSKLNQCAMSDTCKWARDESYKAAVANEIKGLFNKLTKTYKELKKQSPNSDIYAVGYPQIMNTNLICNDLLGVAFNQTERIFIKESLAYINNIVQLSAKNAGVKYIDIEQAFLGNMLCDSTSNPAMNGIRFGDDIAILNLGKHIGNESFHPTPYGHQLIAEYMEGQILLLPDTNEKVDYEQIGTLQPEAAPEYWPESALNNVEVRHLDILTTDTNDSAGILSAIDGGSEMNLEVKRLGKDETLIDITFHKDNLSEVIQGVNYEDWEPGVYSLTLKCRSLNDTPLEIYSTHIFEMPKEVDEDETEPSSPQEENTKEEGMSNNIDNKDNTAENNEKVDNSIETISGSASGVSDPALMHQKFYELPQTNIDKNNKSRQLLTTASKVMMKEKENSSNKEVKREEVQSKKDPSTKLATPNEKKHTESNEISQEVIQLSKFVGFTMLSLGITYVAIRKISSI